MKITRLTSGPKHHFFGFHDLVASNKDNNEILSLEVDIINRPPLTNEMAGVGYINNVGEYVKIGETNAYNYPQGARMQWIEDSNQFVVNNQVGNDWGANIYDTSNNSLVEILPQSVHCLSPDGKTGYTINYSRLFRLGVYGYIGLEDKFKSEIAPQKDGIIIQDIESKKSKLLISTFEVANHEPLFSPDRGFHHYLTHLCLNPSGSKIAFLHRYRLQDGGETTRLMTINTNGTNLKCLAAGFLSHFDWQDDDHIVIFGKQGGAIDSIRNSRFLSNPIIGKSARLFKKVIRPFLKANNALELSFLKISALDASSVSFAKGIIVEDGHPMFNPKNGSWLSNDTYPSGSGIRTLMLYNTDTNERINLAEFKMISDPVDTQLLEQYTKGVDKEILNLFSLEAYSFTRSGLHCDLHPRWNSLGTQIIFDSIHEGSRQIYVADVASLTDNV